MELPHKQSVGIANRFEPDISAGRIWAASLLLVSLATGGILAQSPGVFLEYSVEPALLKLHLTNDVALYYLMEQSTNLPAFFPWSMRLGNGGPTWDIPVAPGDRSEFFRASWYSLYAPGDLDKDGIDDVFELEHPGVLNPLDPSDASLIDPSSGLTWRKVYDQLYGRRIPKNEAISHEVSLFNFGADLPGNKFEGISLEVSVYNFGVDLPGDRYEALSQEVSFYSGEHPPSAFFHDTISSEVSIYNFGVDLPGVRFEAISQEVSVYQGMKAPLPYQHDTISPEVSLYNFGADLPGVRYEAISLEVSLYNNL